MLSIRLLNRRSRISATASTRPYTTQEPPRHEEADTTGAIKHSQSIIGGALGLVGAPTFQRGENVVTLLKRDHRRVETLAEDYDKATTVEKRREIARELTKDLVQHSEVEQLLVYPLLKMRGQAIEKQQDMHDGSLDEHQRIRELLYDLDQTEVEDSSHKEKLKRVMAAVKEHVKEEEEVVIPTIESNYSSEELERLGNAFEKHKYTATTRPHPNAPAQGPLAAAANIISKAYDMTRDAIESISNAGSNQTEEQPAERTSGSQHTAGSQSSNNVQSTNTASSTLGQSPTAGSQSSNTASNQSSNTVGGQSSNTVGGQSSNTVGGQSSNTVGGQSSNTVGGQSSNTVGGQSSNTVGGQSSNTVGSQSTYGQSTNTASSTLGQSPTAGSQSSNTASNQSTYSAGGQSSNNGQSTNTASSTLGKSPTAGSQSSNTASNQSTYSAGNQSSNTVGGRTTDTAGGRTTDTVGGQPPKLGSDKPLAAGTSPDSLDGRTETPTTGADKPTPETNKPKTAPGPTPGSSASSSGAGYKNTMGAGPGSNP